MYPHSLHQRLFTAHRMPQLTSPEDEVPEACLNPCMLGVGQAHAESLQRLPLECYLTVVGTSLKGNLLLVSLLKGHLHPLLFLMGPAREGGWAVYLQAHHSLVVGTSQVGGHLFAQQSHTSLMTNQLVGIHWAGGPLVGPSLVGILLVGNPSVGCPCLVESHSVQREFAPMNRSCFHPMKLSVQTMEEAGELNLFLHQCGQAPRVQWTACSHPARRGRAALRVPGPLGGLQL